jgi:hypothetical protein
MFISYFLYWDHEISIILTVQTVYREKLPLSSLLLMEIVTIRSWKSRYISVWFWLLCDLLEMLNFNKYQSRNISGLIP